MHSLPMTILALLVGLVVSGCTTVSDRLDDRGERVADGVQAYCDRTTLEDREAIRARVAAHLADTGHEVTIGCFSSDGEGGELEEE